MEASTLYRMAVIRDVKDTSQKRVVVSVGILSDMEKVAWVGLSSRQCGVAGGRSEQGRW